MHKTLENMNKYRQNIEWNMLKYKVSAINEFAKEMIRSITGTVEPFCAMVEVLNYEDKCENNFTAFKNKGFKVLAKQQHFPIGNVASVEFNLNDIDIRKGTLTIHLNSTLKKSDKFNIMGVSYLVDDEKMETTTIKCSMMNNVINLFCCGHINEKIVDHKLYNEAVTKLEQLFGDMQIICKMKGINITPPIPLKLRAEV